MFPREPERKDWRDKIKGKIENLGHKGSIKELKDYTLIEEKLYRRLLGGILSRCINEKEGKLRLEELHSQICGIVEKNKPIQKNAVHGVLLAKSVQGGCNYTRGMSKVSAFSG